jgi:hypothetical protein
MNDLIWKPVMAIQLLIVYCWLSELGQKMCRGCYWCTPAVVHFVLHRQSLSLSFGMYALTCGALAFSKLLLLLSFLSYHSLQSALFSGRDIADLTASFICPLSNSCILSQILSAR